MMRLLPSFVLFGLATPFLLGAGPDPSSRVSSKVRMAQHSLEAIAAAKPGQEVGFPSFLRGSVSHLPAPGVAMVAGEGEPILNLVLVLDGPVQPLLDAGFVIPTVTGRVAVAWVPLSRVDELSAMPGVHSVDMSLPVKPYLDVSAPEINADDAHGGPAPDYPADGTTGQGVVVGLVDSGIDLTHNDFRDASGMTRLAYVWDQNDANTTTPGGPSDFTCVQTINGATVNWCGAEWTRAQIQAGGSRERDVVGHGTHVAGIAAGNGRATGNGRAPYTYVGIAPRSDLVMVNTAFYTASIIQGVDYCLKRAGSKPCVVNLSLGSQFGGHDGSSDMDLALADLSGPGRIMVAAAGNEGDQRIHADMVIPTGQTRTFQISVGPTANQPGEQNEFIWCEAWFQTGLNFTMEIVSPNGYKVGPASEGQEMQTNSNDGTLYIYRKNPVSTTHARLADLVILDLNADRRPVEGIYKINVKNEGTAPAALDIWIPLSTLVTPPPVVSTDVEWFGDGGNYDKLVSSPATSDSVLAVGAYTTKRQWTALDGQLRQYSSPLIALGKLAPFSSLGPRRDGVLKPDICAPGIGIASSRGKDASLDAQLVLQDGVHVINQGTSQATPHVTGAVALLLEENPRLSMAQVRTALAAGARSDANTGVLPSAAWGAGKLDVAASVEAVRVPFILAVLQNPYLSQYLDIFLAAPTNLDPESVVLTVGEDTVPMTQIDAENGVYRSDYTLTGTGAVSVTACGNPPGADPSCQSITVAGKAISPGTEFSLASDDGRFRVLAPGSSVSSRGYALVLPEAWAWTGDLATRRTRGGYVVPATEALSGPITVEFAGPAVGPDPQNRQIVMDGHGPLASVFDADTWTLRAVAPGPGTFRLGAGVSTTADAGSLRILAAAPNPFQGSTRIRFAVETKQRMTMSVYDLAGRQVVELLDAVVEAGDHDVIWNGTARDGTRASAGVYFIRAASEHATASHKILLQP